VLIPIHAHLSRSFQVSYFVFFSGDGATPAADEEANVADEPEAEVSSEPEAA